jgi:hypothetical protein
MTTNLEICASRYVKGVLLYRAWRSESDSSRADALLAEILRMFNLSDEEFKALGGILEAHVAELPEHKQVPSVDP